MKRLDQILERTLFGVFVASLFLPLLLALSFRFLGVPHFMVTQVLANQCLKGTGIQDPADPFVYSWSALRSGQLQKQISDRFNFTFGGRELLIRLTDEVYFRVFQVSPIKTANLLVGRNTNLFERWYLEDYCLDRVETGDLMPLVQQIKRLQDACQDRGIGFALVITPSKASILPDKIPSAWQQRIDPRPRAYDLFLPLIQKAGIRYVDGHALTEESRASSPAPLFPMAGSHWGWYPALQTTNQVLSTLQEQGQPLTPLAYDNLRVSYDPLDQDADLFSIMNLCKRWHYPVSELDVKPVAASPGTFRNLTIVGGSFMWKMQELILASRQFSEIDCYFYYKQFKASFGDSDNDECRYLPTKDMDFSKDFFATDCLLLEINEQVLSQTRNHLTEFCKDALNHLPKATDARAPFRYESFFPYTFGDEILFADPAPARNLDSFYVRGLTGPDFNGDSASVRVNLVPAHRDAMLKLYFDSTVPKPGDALNLTVSFNGRVISQWSSSTSGPAECAGIVPESLLEKGGPAVVTLQLTRNPATQAQPISLRLDKMKLELSP